ncbi:MAG: glycosyltransferase family 2 protein [Acutalibacteraceae bacterium]
MARVSVGIVTYNSADKIGAVLESLYTRTDLQKTELTVYVIDNHSTDGTRELVASRFPQAVLLAQPDNRGFGYAHNRVLALLDSDYHVIVNPDITFETDVLSSLAAYLDAHEDTVMVTPLIQNADGTPQAVPRVLPKRRYMFAGKLERFGQPFRRWRDEYTRRNEHFTQPTPVDFCTGCFMMLRTAAFRALGGFDDRFFMYCEDADLSRRAAAYGRLMLIPAVTVTHEWERASGQSGKFLKIHLQSMHRYFKKWRNGT